MSKFKLEHGKTYQQRNGLIVPPVCDLRNHGSLESEDSFGAWIGGHLRTWFPDGKYIQTSENPFDLVREYVEPPPMKWVPFTDRDFPSLFGRIVQLKDDSRTGVIQYSMNGGVSLSNPVSGRPTYPELLRWYTFADGTPCGKLETPQ